MTTLQANGRRSRWVAPRACLREPPGEPDTGRGGERVWLYPPGTGGLGGCDTPPRTEHKAVPGVRAANSGTLGATEPLHRPRRGGHVIVRLRGAHNSNRRRPPHRGGQLRAVGERSEAARPPKPALAVNTGASSERRECPPEPEPPRACAW